MEESELRGTTVVCRSGSPTNLQDLRKVAAAKARWVREWQLHYTDSDGVERVAVTLH